MLLVERAEELALPQRQVEGCLAGAGRLVLVKLPYPFAEHTTRAGAVLFDAGSHTEQALPLSTVGQPFCGTVFAAAEDVDPEMTVDVRFTRHQNPAPRHGGLSPSGGPADTSMPADAARTRVVDEATVTGAKQVPQRSALDDWTLTPEAAAVAALVFADQLDKAATWCGRLSTPTPPPATRPRCRPSCQRCAPKQRFARVTWPPRSCAGGRPRVSSAERLAGGSRVPDGPPHCTSPRRPMSWRGPRVCWTSR
jgi:hypothetical protein